MNPYDFTRGTAIVTGAASGIGEQLAHALARRGSALALARIPDVLARVTPTRHQALLALAQKQATRR